MSEPAVSIREVSKRFGSVQALRSVSLDVPPSAFLTVVGKSGSGKSTLLRAVGGFEAPDSGRIFFAGEDVTAQPAYQRRSNTVFQSYALFPHLLSAWLAAFVVSFDDVVVASFVAGPGSSTLPIVIFSSVRLGVSPSQCARRPAVRARRRLLCRRLAGDVHAQGLRTSAACPQPFR